MMLTELKTAAEVREHARMVQRRINQRRGIHESAPPPDEAAVQAAMAPKPEPLPDEVPAPEDQLGDLPLHDLAPVVKGHPTRTVFAIAADYFGLKLRDVIGQSRLQRLILPRQIGCFVAHRLGASYPKIGRAARRDHSTICYCTRAIAERIRADDSLADAVDVIGRKAAEMFGAAWRSVRQADQ
jgi:hypothetical protein